MQARVIADQTARSLQSVDLVLRHVGEQLRVGLAMGQSREDLRAYLKDQAVGLVQIAGLSWIDSTGQLRATSGEAAVASAQSSFAGLDGFEAARRGRSPDLVVGNAMRSPLNPEAWVIPILRRIETPEGEFAGAVMAEGRVDYFHDFYRNVQLDKGTRITLVHRNGTLLARYPPIEAALGRHFPLFDTLLDARRSQRTEASRLRSPVDGVDRFGALQIVPDYPLAIIVAREAATVLAPWRQQSIGTALRTLALGILAALLLAALRSQFLRLDRVRESLEVSRERFALAAAGSDVGIWDWDIIGDRIFASRRAREIFGLAPGPDSQSRSDWFAAIAIHPDDAADRSHAIDLHLTGRSPAYEGEYRVRGQDGVYRWVRVRGLCVRDANKAPMRMAGSVADIDARKRAEDALRLSEERYALAMTGSTGGHWVWDVASDALFVSETMNLMFGLPADTQAGTRRGYSKRVRIHPDDRVRLSKIDAEVFSGRATRVDFEYRVLLPETAEIRWIMTRAQCFRDAAGTAVRVAGVSVDATERKRTEEDLRLSEERFALAVAGSHDGIVDWDIVNDRMYTSERTMEMLGVDSTVTVRTRADWLALLRLHPDDTQRHADDLQRFFEGGAALREGEYRVLRGDGECHWIRLRNLCVRDDAGRPVRLAGSVSDIDAYKRVEAALRESEARYALAMTGSNEGHWVWDLTRDELFASAKLCELMGWPAVTQTIPYADYLERLPVHPDDAQRLRKSREDLLADLVPRLDVEFRIILAASAEVRWLHSRGQCFRDADGHPVRVAGATVDVTQRKRDEDSLRRSEERYALAVAGSDDGVWDWDFVAGRAFESERARELQGLPPGPDLQPLDELVESLQVHPDDVALRAEALRAHLAGEVPAYECEYRVRRSDGYRWIRVRALCIRDAAGKACRLAGSVSDIDARKRAEDALRESEERFALAVAGTNDGILDWDIVDDHMYVSERALRIVGLEPDARFETRGDWEALLMPRLHPDDARRLTDELHVHPGEHPRAHEGEYRLRGADGQYRWTRFRGMSVHDVDGRPIRWAGSISDIDAAKQTEEALRRSEERYQLAVAGSNEGLWDWDLATDSLFLSARAQELLWLEPGEPQRPRPEWIALTKYHPEDRALVHKALSDHLKGATRHFKVEYRIQHHTGSWHWYRQRGIAVRDAHGRPMRMAGSMEDITERKNFEADRDRLESELRQAQKLEAIGTLAGGIAHDFNNILAAILGYGEMAQKDAPEGSAQRRHIDAAISAGMRAKSLVERILAFSRTGVAERVPVHVESVVEEALELVSASLPAGIVLERQLESSDAAVLGDPTQVHQVVMNLCANAVQSMKSKGTLRVTLDLMGMGGSRCATSVLSDSNHIRLRVTDTGSGISPALRERIFDPFFTTKEIGVGTGLGLSLVHGIVTDLGGGIEVDSSVGEGSTFTVYLPWQSCVAAPVRSDDPLPPRGSGETILLVDDEESLVRLGEESIAELGYEPVGFTSSLAALAAFRAEPLRFHAVLSDEAMPEMTGSELAAEIRRIRPDIPIVLMSGYVTSALSARARDAGVVDVLAKPLVSLDIARSLAGALPR